MTSHENNVPSNRWTSSFNIFCEACLVTLKTRHFYHLYILGLLLCYCIIFYYFGELVDLFKWETLRRQIFYDAHHVQRIAFLAPVIYSCYVFGAKTGFVIALVSLASVLPRAIFLLTSGELMWTLFFAVVVIIIPWLAAEIGRKFQKPRPS